MNTMLKFLFRRLLAIPVTLLLITAALYGITMLAPAEVRAQIYMPSMGNNPAFTEAEMRERIIEEYGLNDPYLVQYTRWLSALLQGDWGWSPQLPGYILEALIARTPTTAELTLLSVLFFVPLGIISGVVAGWKRNRVFDRGFRLTAFIATAMPPFILGLVLLAVFYVALRWFPPGRISLEMSFEVSSPSFESYTGMLTIDGLLNGRLDVTLDALRHLVLPAFTLSLAHWATLGRVTRVTMIDELTKPYTITAKGKGLKTKSIVWTHALRNTLVPGLNSTALSAASLIMGVYVVEVVFALPGVSELIASGLGYYPDTPLALGFAIYSVLLVLPLMLILDIAQGIADPRIREEISEL